MRLSELNPNMICDVFDHATSIDISFSWLGTPTVTIQENGQVYSDELSDLKEVAIDAIKKPFNADTYPLTLIETAYLAGRISDLQERSKAQIESEDCITRIFFQVRESLAVFFKKFTINPRNDYVTIPVHIAQKDDFVRRFPPHHTDSTGSALYTYQQVLQIRQDIRRA